jgi:hypothetical protein
MLIDVLQLKRPMRTRTKVLIGAVFVAVTAVCRLYYVDEGTLGAWLLWNDKEFYCFDTIVRRGYFVSYLGYPWAIFMAYLSVPSIPDEERRSLEVIHVTSAGVEHHTLHLEGPGTTPTRYTAIGGSIYADCEASLCRWAGDRFEAATPEERQRLGDTSHLDKDEDIEHENGWSKRTPISPDRRDFTIPVGNQFAISIKHSHPNDPSNDALSIYVVRSGRDEKIAEIPEHTGRISGSEYHRRFPGPE